MYQVILSLEFQKAFYKLPNPIQERVRKIIAKMENKLIGEPLKGDLKDFYSVHFESNRYRLIYYKENNVIKILVLHVGKRTKNFYEEFKRDFLKYKRLNR